MRMRSKVRREKHIVREIGDLGWAGVGRNVSVWSNATLDGFCGWA